MQLDEFQDVIARTYGERDAARGRAATVAWLCEELGELAQAGVLVLQLEQSQLRRGIGVQRVLPRCRVHGSVGIVDT